jgi:hypothetical protein
MDLNRVLICTSPTQSLGTDGVDTGLISWICLYGWGIMLRLGCMSGSGIVCIDGSWGIITAVCWEV